MWIKPMFSFMIDYFFDSGKAGEHIFFDFIVSESESFEKIIGVFELLMHALDRRRLTS